jgi:hypothetical protein
MGRTRPGRWHRAADPLGPRLGPSAPRGFADGTPLAVPPTGCSPTKAATSTSTGDSSRAARSLRRSPAEAPRTAMARAGPVGRRACPRLASSTFSPEARLAVRAVTPGCSANARSHSRKFRYRPLKCRCIAGLTRPRGIAEIVTQSVRIPCRSPQQTADVVPRPPQLISPTEPARQPPGHGLQPVRHPSKLVQALLSMPGRRSPAQEDKQLELRMPMRPEAARSADFDDAATLQCPSAMWKCGLLAVCRSRRNRW